MKARYFRLPKNINTRSNVYINSVKSSFRLHTLVLIQKENPLISSSKSYKGRYIYRIFCSLVSNVCISFVWLNSHDKSHMKCFSKCFKKKTFSHKKIKIYARFPKLKKYIPITCHWCGWRGTLQLSKSKVKQLISKYIHSEALTFEFSTYLKYMYLFCFSKENFSNKHCSFFYFNKSCFYMV